MILFEDTDEINYYVLLVFAYVAKFILYYYFDRFKLSNIIDQRATI